MSAFYGHLVGIDVPAYVVCCRKADLPRVEDHPLDMQKFVRMVRADSIDETCFVCREAVIVHKNHPAGKIICQKCVSDEAVLRRLEDDA